MELWMLFVTLPIACVGSAVAGGSACAIVLARKYKASKEQVGVPASICAQISASIAALALLRLYDPRLVKTLFTVRADPLVLAGLIACSIIILLLMEKLVRGTNIGLIKPILSCAEKFSGICVLLPCFIAPVTEEILFRGAGQAPTTLAMGPWPALLLISVMFCVGHVKALGVKPLPLVFLQALVFGLPIALWGSLLPCILLHLIANIVGSRRALKAVLRGEDVKIVLQEELAEKASTHQVGETL